MTTQITGRPCPHCGGFIRDGAESYSVSGYDPEEIRKQIERLYEQSQLRRSEERKKREEENNDGA